MLLLLLFLAAQVANPPADLSQPVTADMIVSQMVAHDLWQDAHLLGYQVSQHFDAKNTRFKVQATRDVRATFHSPATTEYAVVRRDGSRIIQSQVFDEVMKAETETDSKEARQQTDIRPANYNFVLQGTDSCNDRKCYRLTLVPKRKDKYSLEGTVWIDAEDFAIARLQGIPAKKPSFWTVKTEIDQHYRKVDGFWLPDFIDSWSDIRIFGHSTFRIDFSDYTVRGSGLAQ